MLHDLLPKGRKDRRSERTEHTDRDAAQSDGRTSRSEKRRDGRISSLEEKCRSAGGRQALTLLCQVG